jgi:hypothetical protein
VVVGVRTPSRTQLADVSTAGERCGATDMAAAKKEEKSLTVADLRVVAEDLAKQLKTEVELTDEQLSVLLALDKEGSVETKVDKRFPNVNQAQNCWCVVGCGAARDFGVKGEPPRRASAGPR